MTTDSAGRRERFAELARDEYREASDELADAEALIAEMRERKKAALQVLRLYDPESSEVIEAERERETQRERKLQGKQHPGSTKIGRENREKIAEWLREHQDDPALEDGFKASDLPKHPEWGTLPGTSSVQTALPLLADEGVVRLDRIGWTGKNGRGQPRKIGREAKVYKVVRRSAST